MRSALPRCCTRSADSRCSRHVLRAVRTRPAQTAWSWSGPITMRSRRRRARDFPDAQIARQMERLGTAHAVLAARRRDRARLRRYSGGVRRHAAGSRRRPCSACARALGDGAAVAVAGFTPADPTGYGRLVVERRQAACDPRAQRCQRERTRDPPLQWRADGARRASRRCRCSNASATTMRRRNSI